MHDRLVSDLELLAAMYADADTDPLRGWDAVHGFEAEHGVTLPEPYRSLVATITRGGDECGPPDYGLIAPGAGHHDWPTFEPVRLDQAFPLTEAWAWADVDSHREGVAPYDVCTRGGLPLGTDGCGMFWVLVVTGRHRGHIWSIDPDFGALPFGREFGHTTGESGFLGWVTHWYSGADWWDALPGHAQ